MAYDPHLLVDATRKLPVYNARQIHEVAEYLYIMLYEHTQLDPHVIQWRRQQTAQQAKIGETIHQHKLAGIHENIPSRANKN